MIGRRLGLGRQKQAESRGQSIRERGARSRVEGQGRCKGKEMLR